MTREQLLARAEVYRGKVGLPARPAFVAKGDDGIGNYYAEHSHEARETGIDLQAARACDAPKDVIAAMERALDNWRYVGD